MSTLVKPELKPELNVLFANVVAPLPGVVNVLVTVEPPAKYPTNEIGTGDSDGEFGSANCTEVKPNMDPFVRLKET